MGHDCTIPIGKDTELILERTWNTSLLCATLPIQENGEVKNIMRMITDDQWRDDAWTW